MLRTGLVIYITDVYYGFFIFLGAFQAMLHFMQLTTEDVRLLMFGQQ